MIMENLFSPTDFVVPVLGLRDDRAARPEFLGTAFFVRQRARVALVTCDHVLENWRAAYGIALETGRRVLDAHVLMRDRDRDLALLEVPEYTPSHALPLLSTDAIKLNQLVTCFEYGPTVTAGDQLEFEPASRVGNVTRARNLSRFGKAGERMLELSFPALRGASGAPVMMQNPPFTLLGIVKANVSYELLPVQVEKIVDEQGRVEEETKFFLPQALAIHVCHVRDVIADLERKAPAIGPGLKSV